MLETYLRRLGLARTGPPSADGLAALHRAHVERVAYETIEIHLGRPTTVDPHESAARVAGGRGGYCFHLNGAFSILLRALGYQVRWHLGGVTGPGSPTVAGASGNHLALTVVGLPSPANPGGCWLADVGLGDALYDPLPLLAGDYQQGPFRFRLAASDVVPGGWRFDHDPAGSFTRMDFAPGLAGPADFAESHRWLSTDPESGFVRILSVQRRHRDGVDALRGCVLASITAAGRTERLLDTERAWFDTLGDVFGLTFTDVPANQLAGLWQRTRAAHDRWSAQRVAG